MNAASDSGHTGKLSQTQPEAQQEAPVQHSTATSRDPRFIDHHLDEETDLRHVQGKFQSIVSRVEELFGTLYDTTKPYSDKVVAVAEQYPILFTFAFTWIAFSSIPIIIFTSLQVAILLPILAITTILSALTLSFLLGLFVIHRLYLHLSSATSNEWSIEAVGEGFKGWVEEVGEKVGLNGSEPIVLKQSSYDDGRATGGKTGEKSDSSGNVTSTTAASESEQDGHIEDEKAGTQELSMVTSNTLEKIIQKHDGRHLQNLHPLSNAVSIHADRSHIGIKSI
ncbi:hypothetical protein I305_03364 [Cryptococcus gattii E566]|uniref:Uncharacterized protein n=2 Tax=Cryptococcus gattii TaxID=37769 RepID=E6R5P7_CRYGW|nr:Hypothetical protein CGB_D2100C [Cryptococcus gattii WM276]ADV21673.1 Hypothetical protein CGB_D2100C [Cryptococcus gattii WM276]KIR80916.1 hypothetical protein I306_01955 [Cryptococcus gattii EJB2]KIY34018.1 hypothetical protein I305_03364 [Cryptococcus gattii E566]KJE02981.1 hypothetical protein I311_03259 [Cryptococcus gattii NT-10]